MNDEHPETGHKMTEAGAQGDYPTAGRMPKPAVQLPDEYAPAVGHAPRTFTQDEHGHYLPVKSPGRLWRFAKRGLLAILIPVGLMVIAGITLAAFGPDTLSTLRNSIVRFWWIATAGRVAVYAFISWLLLPVMMRRIKNTALERLEIQRNTLFAEGIADSYALQQIEAQTDKIQHTRIRPTVFFAGLVLFDVITLQLPYFLK